MICWKDLQGIWNWERFRPRDHCCKVEVHPGLTKTRLWSFERFEGFAISIYGHLKFLKSKAYFQGRYSVVHSMLVTYGNLNISYI
jgi:hypothetical protein